LGLRCMANAFLIKIEKARLIFTYRLAFCDDSPRFPSFVIRSFASLIIHNMTESWSTRQAHHYLHVHYGMFPTGNSYTKVEDGDDDEELQRSFTQWQQWAYRSVSPRRHDHQHPTSTRQSGGHRWLNTPNDLLSEHVDPQEEQHMRFPFDLATLSLQEKRAPLVNTATLKSAPGTRPPSNPLSCHDNHDDHFRSGSTSTRSLLRKTLYNQQHYQQQQEKVSESFHQAQEQPSSLQRWEYSADDTEDRKCKPWARAARKTSETISASSSVDCPMLRVTFSLVRQQEAIMCDIQQRHHHHHHHQEKGTGQAFLATTTTNDTASLEVCAPPNKAESSLVPSRDTCSSKQIGYSSNKQQDQKGGKKGGRATIPLDGRGLVKVEGRRVRILDPVRVQQAICIGKAVVLKCLDCQQDLLVTTDCPMIYCPECGVLVPTALALQQQHQQHE